MNVPSLTAKAHQGWLWFVLSERNKFTFQCPSSASPILPPVTIPSSKDLFQFLLLLWTLSTITSILFEEQCHKLAM